MRRKILIIKNSSRKIIVEEVFTLYSYQVINALDIELEEINKIDCVIIDIENFDNIIECANKIRDYKKDIPLLIIVDQTDYINVDNLLLNIDGYGRCDIAYFHSLNTTMIQRKVHGLIHPELPSRREEIAIILPIYNEEHRIDLVKKFFQNIRDMQLNGYFSITIYLINDGSEDGTAKIMNEFMEKDIADGDIVSHKSMFSMKELSVNTKKAGTYIYAFKCIDADILVYSDSDNSFTIEDIGKMINVLTQGYYDMVIGTKDQADPNRPLIRKIMSFGKRLVIRPFMPKGITDSQTGLKAMKSTVVNYIVSELDVDFGLAIDLKIMNMAKKKHFRVLQMPVKFKEQEGSHVEIVKDSIKFIKSIFRLMFNK